MYLRNSSTLILILYLCGAVGMDVWKRKVLNKYIVFGFLILLFIEDYHIVLRESTLLGICILPVYLIGALGAGDIKLLCVMAGFLSAEAVFGILLYALIITALAGGIVKIILLFRKERENIQNYPFTISILLSLISYIWGWR